MKIYIQSACPIQIFQWQVTRVLIICWVGKILLWQVKSKSTCPWTCVEKSACQSLSCLNCNCKLSNVKLHRRVTIYITQEGLKRRLAKFAFCLWQFDHNFTCSNLILQVGVCTVTLSRYNTYCRYIEYRIRIRIS